jgi:hypothetical protein
MDELLQHLATDEMNSLFPDGYNHVLAEVYNVLYYAVRDRADELRLNAKTFVWSNDRAKVKEHSLQAKPSVSYRSQLLLILQYDPTLQRYAHITADSADEIVIEFSAR